MHFSPLNQAERDLEDALFQPAHRAVCALSGISPYLSPPPQTPSPRAAPACDGSAALNALLARGSTPAASLGRAWRAGSKSQDENAAPGSAGSEGLPGDCLRAGAWKVQQVVLGAEEQSASLGYTLPSADAAPGARWG